MKYKHITFVYFLKLNISAEEIAKIGKLSSTRESKEM